jgi:hypothetical protein
VLDVGRSLTWAIISQIYRPICDSVFPLSSVDLAAWADQGFQCEHQADIQIPDTNAN